MFTKNKKLKLSIALFICLAEFAWLFSGWPSLWQNPPAPLDKYLSGPIPPAIREALAQAGSAAGLKGFVRGFGGLYGLDLSYAPSEQNPNIGFRCGK